VIVRSPARGVGGIRGLGCGCSRVDSYGSCLDPGACSGTAVDLSVLNGTPGGEFYTQTSASQAYFSPAAATGGSSVTFTTVLLVVAAGLLLMTMTGGRR
jgi:hypothetical protein